LTQLRGNRVSAKFTWSPSTLSACSQIQPPQCAFSWLGDLPNNLILLSLSPEKTRGSIYEDISQVHGLWHIVPRADNEAALFTGVRGIIEPPD
jgi:hypothetical protein